MTTPTNAAHAAIDRARAALEPARRFAQRVESLPATTAIRAVAAKLKEITHVDR